MSLTTLSTLTTTILSPIATATPPPPPPAAMMSIRDNNNANIINNELTLATCIYTIHDSKTLCDCTPQDGTTSTELPAIPIPVGAGGACCYALA